LLLSDGVVGAESQLDDVGLTERFEIVQERLNCRHFGGNSLKGVCVEKELSIEIV
jgi:hypothetical protein